MIKIRFGTFETNSSSAHSLIIVSKKDFDLFRNGKKVFHIGRFGVPSDYADKRSQDGEILSFECARDLYVEYLRAHEHFKREYLLKLGYVAGREIKTVDDITVEDFKKAVNTNSNYIFGDFKTFSEWEEGYSDWENVNGKSTWSENKDGLIEMETNWRNG